MTVAFVAGATGLVGRAVVAELCRRGVATIAHVRPDSRELTRWQHHFAGLGAQVSTAPWEAGALAADLMRVHASHVFCLVGTTRARKAHAARPEVETYEAVDYGLTKRLADAATQAGFVQRFVYLSSAGTGPEARGAYLQARWRAEEAVRHSGVPATIARPSIIVGERDDERPLEKAAAGVLDGVLMAAGALGARGLRDRYRSTDAETLAKALVRLAFEPDSAGATVESEGLR